MLRDGRDRTVPQRPLRYVAQLLWVLLLIVICHPSAGHAIVITAQSWFGWCEDPTRPLLVCAVHGSKANRLLFRCHPTVCHRLLSCEKLFL